MVKEMNILIYENSTEIGEVLGRKIIKRIKCTPDAAVGFATGMSPLPTYNYIVEEFKKGEVSFADMKTFNLDEYCSLPKTDKNSYYSFMMDNLFGKIGVNPENINFLDGNAEDEKAESERFSKAIENAGGISLQILGIGTNGHIGFNEPADEFTDNSFIVELTESTIASNQKFFGDTPMPRYAFTMGIGLIMKAKEIFLIATGENKAQAVYDMVKGEVTPKCPASILQTHPNTTVLLDEAAASLL